MGALRCADMHRQLSSIRAAAFCSSVTAAITSSPASPVKGGGGRVEHRELWEAPIEAVKRHHKVVWKTA
jgi:hypothetical protein